MVAAYVTPEKNMFIPSKAVTGKRASLAMNHSPEPATT